MLERNSWIGEHSRSVFHNGEMSPLRFLMLVCDTQTHRHTLTYIHICCMLEMGNIYFIICSCSHDSPNWKSFIGYCSKKTQKKTKRGTDVTLGEEVLPEMEQIKKRRANNLGRPSVPSLQPCTGLCSGMDTLRNHLGSAQIGVLYLCIYGCCGRRRAPSVTPARHLEGGGRSPDEAPRPPPHPHTHPGATWVLADVPFAVWAQCWIIDAHPVSLKRRSASQGQRIDSKFFCLAPFVQPWGSCIKRSLIKPSSRPSSSALLSR